MQKLAFIAILVIISCQTKNEKEMTSKAQKITEASVIVLGTVQDGGAPHTGCNKNCCKDLWGKPSLYKKVVSLGIVDPESQKIWLFEATPDFPTQVEKLSEYAPFKTTMIPDGIFLTHAHIGHYTGLMYLGKESINSNMVPVYAMPRMQKFLETNGPWDQLVKLNNIKIVQLKADSTVYISKEINVTPILVPHRHEYSETVGFIICGPHKKVLFIPDIDKWKRWNRDIIEEVKKVDIAYIDATFYSGKELNNRDMSEIPHPFVLETMKLFDSEAPSERSKIRFIHLNHTNPLLKKGSDEYHLVLQRGYGIAQEGEIFEL